VLVRGGGFVIDKCITNADTGNFYPNYSIYNGKWSFILFDRIPLARYYND
jgi:hypothetical protein